MNQGRTSSSSSTSRDGRMNRELRQGPGALFECVAEHDVSGLLCVLAAEGLRVLRSCAGSSVGGGYHPMTDEHHRQETKESSDEGLGNTEALQMLMEELTQFVQQREQEDDGDDDECMFRPSARSAVLEISAEAEQLLRNSLASMVDTRPPADFVVYGPDREDLSLSHHQQQQDQAQQPLQQQDPPLFDGSVANSTPPPLEGGPAGGAGTLMHLATALDQPLVLALLLCLGGDARACHTAFRRLLIHEAACNGSVHCLTLLLELGRKYNLQAEQQQQKLQHQHQQQQTTPLARASLPFLPRRLDRAQALAALPFLAYPASGSTRNRPPSPPAAAAQKGMPGSTNILQLLQQVRTMVPQVRQGKLTEMEAARAVLKEHNAGLKPVSQRALARACQFQNTSSWRGGSLDGHGNTPLHWAAFKNETSCVSLLLAAGADPNARAHPSGWTPLHDAAYSNSVESIELLIRAGATVDARANSGATPLCFAAQEDAQGAVALLLARGANLTTRCAPGQATAANSRFSGYTPLHYCAHYNARKAAVELLSHSTARRGLEIPDLSDRLPIHVAVARGSASVLRELLHAGARVETRWAQQQAQDASSASAPAQAETTRRRPPSPEEPTTPRRNAAAAPQEGSITPVSSPVLRSMIPSQPVQSAKPWNCLTQQSIDECRHLISQAESCWSPERHNLFTPADRQAVYTVLLVGHRSTKGLFPEVWREVLSFCGRGWFEPDSQDMEEDNEEVADRGCDDDEDHFMSSHDAGEDDLRHASHLSLPRF